MFSLPFSRFLCPCVQDFSFRITFAVGYPGGRPILEKMVCREQAFHGDLSLVNIRENLNDGAYVQGVIAPA